MTSATGSPGGPPAPPAASRGAYPPAARRVLLTGRWGLTAISASIAMTFAVAVAGPSVMEPALPGRAGQPPWAASLHLSPYLAVALTAAALAAGSCGLGLCLHACRRGWRVSPRVILVAGLLAAVALALVPPFGSSDHLSYAAYGRMAVTGHDPYTSTPAALARLGDPVARAVQDWRHSPSVYGSLATGAQALASLVGGTSVRLTVFVLSLSGAVAFAVTGLLLFWLARGSRDRQLRTGLLWTFNPLLLQVLVAGAHVDGLAIVFGVAAVSLFRFAMHDVTAGNPAARTAGVAAVAGVSAGLAFAVKVSLVLVVLGLVAAAALAWWARREDVAVGAQGTPGRAQGTPGGAQGVPGGAGGATGGAQRRGLALATAWLVAGFAVTAAVAFIPWGLRSLGPALRAGSFASLASPWRGVRAALSLLTGEPDVDTIIKVGAVVLALAVAALFARPLAALARESVISGLAAPAKPGPGSATTGPGSGSLGPAMLGPAMLGPAMLGPAALGPAALAGGSVFAVVFAWLVAWPYVLPWYDSLAWAMLAVVPWLPSPWAAMDWLLLARTTILGFGYLPARGITMPAGLGWLRSVVRTDLAPLALLAVLVVLIVVLWPRRTTQTGAGAAV